MMLACFGTVAEQKWNTPDCRKAYQRVDNPAHNTCLPTADPGDDVKLENTDNTPVDAANDRE